MASRESLRNELIGMADSNKEALFLPAAQMRKVFRQNALRLAMILAEFGWPERDEVGEEAERAAWTILRQSDEVPGLKMLGLQFLRDMAQRGEIPLVRLALIQDRIRLLEGHPPVFTASPDPTAEDVYAKPSVETPEYLGVRVTGLPPRRPET